MRAEVQKAVVLGAGTKGAQVAAHLVARGIDVALLDIVPPGASDRSALATKAIEGLKKLKPNVEGRQAASELVLMMQGR